MATWAYVAELGSGGVLDWGGDDSGNLPRNRLLPDLNGAFGTIYQLAKDGAYDGLQLDWGAWGLKVNGPQLREVLTAIYGDGVVSAARPPIDSYLKLADELGEHRYVAFVAAEL